jgi:hypothetical protein
MFLRLLLIHRHIPEYLPAISQKHWIEGCTAVMVLYLLALAWMFTTRGTQDGANDADTFLAGTDITNFRRECAPQFT